MKMFLKLLCFEEKKKKKCSGIILLYIQKSIIAFVFFLPLFLFTSRFFYFNEIIKITKKNIGGTSEVVLSYLQEQKTQQ